MLSKEEIEEAKEKLNSSKKEDLIEIIRIFKRNGIENYCIVENKTIKILLQYIDQLEKNVNLKSIKKINREEINQAKENLMFFNEGDYITREMDRSADIIEEYIYQLEQENNKLNKINYEMADMISSLDITINMVAFGGQAKFGCNEEIKQYFEKKVEGK